MFHFWILFFTYDLNLYIVSLNCKFYMYLYTVFSFLWCFLFFYVFSYVFYDYDMFRIPLSCDSLRDLWNEHICMYVCIKGSSVCLYSAAVSNGLKRERATTIRSLTLTHHKTLIHCKHPLMETENVFKCQTLHLVTYDIHISHIYLPCILQTSMIWHEFRPLP
jgi:hypothetical protein